MQTIILKLHIYLFNLNAINGHARLKNNPRKQTFQTLALPQRS